MASPCLTDTTVDPWLPVKQVTGCQGAAACGRMQHVPGSRPRCQSRASASATAGCCCETSARSGNGPAHAGRVPALDPRLVHPTRSTSGRIAMRCRACGTTVDEPGGMPLCPACAAVTGTPREPARFASPSALWLWTSPHAAAALATGDPANEGSVMTHRRPPSAIDRVGRSAGSARRVARRLERLQPGQPAGSPGGSSGCNRAARSAR
jgi:hypothetical protein